MASQPGKKRRKWDEVYRGAFGGGEVILAISGDQIRLDVPRGYAARTVYNVGDWTQVQLVPLPSELGRDASS